MTPAHVPGPSGTEFPKPFDPAAPARGLRVIHSSYGRLRLHLPNWSGKGGGQLANQLRRFRGVISVEATALTRNLLIVFNPQQITAKVLLGRMHALRPTTGHHPRAASSSRPDVVDEGTGRHGRARIAMRGLDRDPHLARKVMERLESRPGVRAHTNLLTGRLLVDYDRHLVHLEDLLAEVANLELPSLPGEDEPAHPLDPIPVARSATRAVGAVVGMSVITVQRLLGSAPSHGPAATIAGIVNLAQGFPLVRDGLRKAMGETKADMTLNAMGIVTLTVGGLSLGLVLAAVEALLMLGEVTSRRAAWRRYEDGLDTATSTVAGAVVRLEAGMRVPRAARVIEGVGTAIGRSGRVLSIVPGVRAPAGARVFGGPFVLELLTSAAFTPQPRPEPPAPDVYRKYLRVAAPVSLAYAVFTGLRTLSLGRAFEALLLVNPRPALVGMEAANLAAAARGLRGGLTVVGTRPKRVVRCPDVLILDGPRMLTDGKELDRVVPLAEGMDADTLLTLAGAITAVTGALLGKVLVVPDPLPATDGAFNGRAASARIDGVRYTLQPARESARDLIPGGAEGRRGGLLLALYREHKAEPLGLIGLRPKLTAGAVQLVNNCQRYGVELLVMPGMDATAAHRIADRAGVTVLPTDDAVSVIRARQQQRKLVAFVSDGAHAAEPFAACDLAIGMAPGHGGYFPARADLLAPDLVGVADFIEAGRRRDQAVRDSVILSTVSNTIGAALALRGPLGLQSATWPVYLSALGALATSWYRLRGGDRPESALAYLVDPRPERWGRRVVPSVLRAFHATEAGLTSADAATRRSPPLVAGNREEILSALSNQLRAPITALMAGGGCVTLVLGQPLNTAIIATTVSLNILAGMWQERQVGRATEALQKMGAATARVLRDGQVIRLPASDVVTGDILVLMPGDRVAADARVLSAQSLEVGEAALTGESLPVAKGPDETSDHNRIVLEGSDVVVGTGRAVVVAVGRQTRLGATGAALHASPQQESPLGRRLGRVLRIALPVAFTGGVLTTVAGLAHGGTPVSAMFTLGITTALSAIPEGLPLLAGVGQAAVARRLAGHNALVRRLAGIEALGRVDVACTDKTGTLTEGSLSVTLVANAEEEVALPAELSADFRRLLLVGGLASPHPDAANANIHPTDVAICRAARAAGLGDELKVEREFEVPFDSARALYVSRIGGRLYLKGAPERLMPRCARTLVHGQEQPLDDAGRKALLDQALRLAARGLRVLAMAEGPADVPADDPTGLTALGFVGIIDPLRVSVVAAVQRCQQAGIRVIMLTGDHPATAETIARTAGLITKDYDEVLTASALHDMPAAELDARLKRVAVIARAAPLDKLHVIESLRRCGHTVAMTGDGVNDAPALRLADVGVAMGKTGTEVARQAADVVLADDDFATLVEALVEGRGFWRNMRNALGLLLGGNAGELGVIVGATALGYGSPLSAAQILIVNLITDALPSLAVVLQRPEHRNLNLLAREGLTALDSSLRRDTIRRSLATCVPTLTAYLWSHAIAGPTEASAVAFASVICTQLAQTLEVGRVEGLLSRSVVGAVGGSLGLLAVAVGVPPVRNALGLLAPSAFGWGTVAVSSVAAVTISRAITIAGKVHPSQLLAALADEMRRVSGQARQFITTPARALPAPA